MDFLKGSEKTYAADYMAKPLHQAGQTGAWELNRAGSRLKKLFDKSPAEYIGQQVGLENKMIRTANEDAGRGLASILKARGMGNSSIGMGIEHNANTAMNEKIAMNNSTLGMRIRDEQIKNALMKRENASALMAPKLNQGIQMQKTKVRSGGLAPIVGAGLGAYFGGKEGAQIGMSMGNAYSNS
jgi:hypothetical protein